MLHSNESRLALRGYVVSLAIMDPCIRRDWRRKCWSLGALVSENPGDTSVSHVLLSRSEPRIDIDFMAPICSSRVKFVSTDWVDACVVSKDFIDEREYIVEEIRERLNSHAPVLQRRQTLPAPLPHRNNSVPSLKACVSAVSTTTRRSDAASARLNPNGVFRGLSLSIYGIDDIRNMRAITHQIVDNGGSIVDFMCDDQYACICSDGVRPMNDSRIQLVSTRWINDCLAHSELLDPGSKRIFLPSRAQLPLLLMRRISICTPFRDKTTTGTIKEIAKLCGIPCIDIREKSHTATHIIVPNSNALQDMPKGLMQKALESRKHIVSTAWLEDTFLFGAVQDESKYYLGMMLCDQSPMSAPFVDT